MITHPLKLPLDDDLRQVDRQLPLLEGCVGGETKSLDGRYHVLNEVLTDWEVDTIVATQQLPVTDRDNRNNIMIKLMST